MAGNPKLTVLHEKLRGKTFEIDREAVSIGRKPGVDIVIPDPSLSSHHADIIRREQNGKAVYVLRDNDSTNGTRVNNEPISEKALKNSDLILFGMVEVLFDGAPGEDNSGDYSQQTHTIDISSLSGNISTSATLVNFNPLAEKEEKKHAMVQKLLMGVIILLGLLVVAAVLLVVLRAMNKI